MRLLPLLVLALATRALAQDDVLQERPKSTTDAGYGFLVYTPPGYTTTPGRHAALVLFLHGAGEQGGGEEPELWAEMIRHGAAKLLVQGATVTTTAAGLKEARNGSRLFANEDAVVIVPQSSQWWNTSDLNAFLTWVMHRYRIDPRRIYVTGISMGGGGTWRYVANEGRSRIASAVPICGAANVATNGPAFLKTPIWAFHSWGDGLVPRTESIGWMNTIGAAYAGQSIASVMTGYPHADGGTGAPASQTMTALYADAGFSWAAGEVGAGDSPLRFTLYTDDAHDSWTRTYADVGTWGWLFRARSVVHPDFENAVVVDDLDEGFSVDGGWVRTQPNAGGFYGWETREAQVATSPSARWEGSVPMPGVYRFSASGTGGSNRTITSVAIDSAAGRGTFNWDQRGGGTTRLGEVAVSGAFVVTVGSTATSGVLIADAIALGFLRSIVVDAGVSGDAGVGDAGAPSDAGSGDAGEVGDAGSGDGGASSDAGSSDGGASSDAGGGDGGEPSDAGRTDSDAGATPIDEPVSGGCGCSQVPAELSWIALGLLAALRAHRPRQAQRKAV